MKSVGIRALQQNAGAVLKEVEKGQLAEVTDRGRRVAWLVPATQANALESLEAAGRLLRAEADLLDLGPPLAVPRSAARPSRRLARMREAER